MLNRKAQILDVASELLQSRSFTSFSYQDLSARLGITKPSVHHHFATKEDLLLALNERYLEGQRRRLHEIDARHETSRERLAAFLGMMSVIGESGTKICPLGALQAEFNVIPERARDQVREMFRTTKKWLTGVLEQGRLTGDFVFAGPAEERAVLILAAVQGALQIGRAEGPDPFTAVVRAIKNGLAPRAIGDFETHRSSI